MQGAIHAAAAASSHPRAHRVGEAQRPAELQVGQGAVLAGGAAVARPHCRERCWVGLEGWGGGTRRGALKHSCGAALFPAAIRACPGDCSAAIEAEGGPALGCMGRELSDGRHCGALANPQRSAIAPGAPPGIHQRDCSPQVQRSSTSEGQVRSRAGLQTPSASPARRSDRIKPAKPPAALGAPPPAPPPRAPPPHALPPRAARPAAEMSEGGPLGYLVINVLEAAGHDSDDAVVWEPEFKQGYARGAPSGLPGAARAEGTGVCLPVPAPLSLPRCTRTGAAAALLPVFHCRSGYPQPVPQWRSAAAPRRSRCAGC